MSHLKQNLQICDKDKFAYFFHQLGKISLDTHVGSASNMKANPYVFLTIFLGKMLAFPLGERYKKSTKEN